MYLVIPILNALIIQACSSNGFPRTLNACPVMASTSSATVNPPSAPSQLKTPHARYKPSDGIPPRLNLSVPPTLMRKNKITLLNCRPELASGDRKTGKT